jgi:NAD(P)-dependent dehydrogenase (short-subunit alcohol dehydrogenase family)
LENNAIAAKGVCLITGVGPGTGSALVEAFIAGGYQVAMLARNEERLAALSSKFEEAHAFPCDVSDTAKLTATVEEVRTLLGAPSIVIHNAVGGAFGDFMEIEPETLERNFQINTMALLHLSRLVADDMIVAGHGVILATGNTAAYRGKAGFAGFAPTKAAQRILLESIARAAGPKGIHAAYVAIDAVIDVPWTRKRLADKPDDFFCKPADIAEACYNVAHQPRSAWVSDIVIRPFGETW